MRYCASAIHPPSGRHEDAAPIQVVQICDISGGALNKPVIAAIMGVGAVSALLTKQPWRPQTGQLRGLSALERLRPPAGLRLVGLGRFLFLAARDFASERE